MDPAVLSAERLPMKYWIDTEFNAKPFAIDLISIGLVAEDGREFYAESSVVDWSKASRWKLENVRPQLNGEGITRDEISYGLRNFTDGDQQPMFWGYFPAYDWVAFVSPFGDHEELPFHYPQLCLEIKQWAIEFGDPELPHQKGNRHHALADARWTMEAWAFLAGLHPDGAERRLIARRPDRSAPQVCPSADPAGRSATREGSRTRGYGPRRTRAACERRRPSPRRRAPRWRKSRGSGQTGSARGKRDS